MKKPLPNLRKLEKKVPAANLSQINQAELFNTLAGQIQVLATRMESLRAQGAGNTSEFQQLEKMLTEVQDRLMMAQARIKA